MSIKDQAKRIREFMDEDVKSEFVYQDLVDLKEVIIRVNEASHNKTDPKLIKALDRVIEMYRSPALEE